MSYITSTLVEFERDQIESIPDNLLTRQKIRMQSFYYELYDSYLRGDKYIVRYMFYSLKSVRKLTPLQLRKKFSKLMPKTEPIAPEAMKDIRQETAGRGVVVYLHGNHDPETLNTLLQENKLPAPLTEFHDPENATELNELKKASFYAFKKDALLLLVHGKSLLENPQFYSILEEYHIPVRSVSFPWLCRSNLTLMQAMTLYRLTGGNN